MMMESSAEDMNRAYAVNDDRNTHPPRFRLHQDRESTSIRFAITLLRFAKLWLCIDGPIAACNYDPRVVHRNIRVFNLGFAAYSGSGTGMDHCIRTSAFIRRSGENVATQFSAEQRNSCLGVRR
jgi:hypothetical protein